MILRDRAEVVRRGTHFAGLLLGILVCSSIIEDDGKECDLVCGHGLQTLEVWSLSERGTEETLRTLLTLNLVECSPLWFFVLDKVFSM